jgi:hypothetical protein
MNFTDIAWEDVDWIHLTQNKIQWRDVVNTEMNMRFEILISVTPCSLEDICRRFGVMKMGAGRTFRNFSTAVYQTARRHVTTIFTLINLQIPLAAWNVSTIRL